MDLGRANVDIGCLENLCGIDMGIMMKGKIKWKVAVWGHVFFQMLLLFFTLPTMAVEEPISAEQAQVITRIGEGSTNAGLKQTATNMATDAATTTFENWFSEFGTAQIELNVDNNGNWDDSAIDLLTPIYDNKKSILFTQFGLRAPDGRTTGNIGLGVRTFYINKWMLGGNVFFDDDVTGKNRRVGFGTEAWTDYLKLSANAYLGTTEWHSSRDFDDYNEKPADGFDVRIESYLPEYPQLGARAMYEQYYGENVALFDKDHLQSDPSAITVGLNYTPIPLVTAGVDYKRGQDSVDETRFSLNLRYTLGQSWDSQVSSNQVALRRSLMGSRYDLVDRNNEIILQYKKKDVAGAIADMTISSVKDFSPADGKTLNTVVVHAVTADGRPAPNTTITWNVSGNAKLSSSSSVTDTNGNASVNITNTIAEQVNVIAKSGEITRTTSSSFLPQVSALNLKLTKDNSPADGIEQNIGQVTLKDDAGRAISGISLTWQVSNGATIVSSDKISDSNGRAVVHFSSKTPGSMKLSVSSLGKNESVNANFSEIGVSNIAVSMQTNNAFADGSSVNVAQAVVNDSNNHPLPGTKVSWSFDNGNAKAITPTTVLTDSNGIATLHFTDTIAESVNLRANANNQSGKTIATFINVPVGNVAVSMLKNNSAANGSTENISQARVIDSNGNPMKNTSVTWSFISGSAKATSSKTVITDANGIATLKFSDRVAENVLVAAKAGEKTGDTTAVFGPSIIDVVRVTGGSIQENSPAYVQVVVKDDAGNLLSGVIVNWAVEGDIYTYPRSSTTDANGLTSIDISTSEWSGSSPLVFASIDGSNPKIVTMTSISFDPGPD